LSFGTDDDDLFSTRRGSRSGRQAGVVDLTATIVLLAVIVLVAGTTPGAPDRGAEFLAPN
jgi:hypothetical protein